MQETAAQAVVALGSDGRLIDSAPDFIELLPMGIYACDDDGRVRWFNSKAAEIWGRRPRLGDEAERFCGSQKVFNLDGTSLRREETAMAMALALRTGQEILGTEATIERPDGTRVTATVHINPIKDARGHVIGTVNVLVDITERKEAEAQQRILFSELNHRFKNNLQMLLAMLGAERRKAHHPETVTILTEALQRVGAMAAAQHALYRADQGKSYDSQEFMGVLYANVAPSLGHGARMHCVATAGELPNATAVPLALIITELAINAAKHGRDASGAVDIKVDLVRHENVFTLTVEDNGPGFELKTDRRSSGLSLVAGLARQIGGSLDVARAPGARCTVKFPASDNPA